MVISPNQRRMSRRPVQLPLPAPRTWGGRRSGAGRKVTPGRRPGVPHLRRPPHVAARPVHVTLRAVEAICCLRAAHVFPHVRRALAVSSREDFRIDHVHLIAEADTGRALSSGVRGLAIRIARVVNRALGRSGRIWGDRYHARALTTPRAVRKRPRVLNNFRKHLKHVTGIDPCSSAAWFTGWSDGRLSMRAARRPSRPREHGLRVSAGSDTALSNCTNSRSDATCSASTR